MFYLISYTLSNLNGQVKKFQEYWKTKSVVPTPNLVASHWCFLNPMSYQIRDFSCVKACDNPNIHVTTILEV